MTRLNDGFARGPRPPLSLDGAHRLVTEAKANTVVLVEGWSDQAAIAHPFAVRFGIQCSQSEYA
jgi:hypothetical protein